MSAYHYNQKGTGLSVVSFKSLGDRTVLLKSSILLAEMWILGIA